jgi:hypothetical protein
VSRYIEEDSRPDALLAAFLAHDARARQAARSLRAGAEVAIAFTDLPGHWRIRVDGHGKLAFEQQPAIDPDFALRIPPQALRDLCATGTQDLGDLGVAFFGHLHGVEPARRIDVQVHSGMVKLARRGWFGLLALGGPKVALWMGRAGLRGPAAMAGALGRLRRR